MTRRPYPATRWSESVGTRRRFAEDGGDVLGRHRTREVVALALDAALGQQQAGLLGGLDAFGRGRHAEVPGERDHRPDDGRRMAALAEFLHEGLVDLDLVGPEGAHRAKRGIAGAEIVEGDDDAHPAKRRQRRIGHRVLGQKHGLGDLELKPRWRQPGPRQDRGDLRSECRVAELDGGKVDGDIGVRRASRPRHRQASSRTQAPIGAIRPSLFGDADELRRHPQPGGRVAPADQALAAR